MAEETREEEKLGSELWVFETGKAPRGKNGKLKPSHSMKRSQSNQPSKTTPQHYLEPDNCCCSHFTSVTRETSRTRLNQCQPADTANVDVAGAPTPKLEPLPADVNSIEPVAAKKHRSRFLRSSSKRMHGTDFNFPTTFDLVLSFPMYQEKQVRKCTECSCSA